MRTGGRVDAALETIDRETAAVLAQFVDSCLADAQARQMWRDMMTAMQYFWRHPFAEEGREEGRQEGREEGRAQERAEAILRTLKWREVDVPDAVRERVLSCGDLDELGAWLDRSYQVADAHDLFRDGS